MKFVLLVCTLLIATHNLAASQTDQEIVIGTVSNNPPFEFSNKNGEPDGFSVELTKTIMERVGISYKFRNIEFADHDKEFAEGNIDLLMSMLYSQDRARSYFFSIPYCNLNYDIVCRRDNDFNTISDLAGKRIVVKNGARSHDLILNLGAPYTRNLITVADMTEGLKMVAQGEADYAISGNRNARNIISKYDLDNLNIFESQIPPQELCITSKDSYLIREVSQAIHMIMSDGTYNKIYYKWFGTKEPKQVSKYVYFALGLFIFISLVFLLFSITLKKQVRNATKNIAEAKDKITALIQSISILIDKSDINVRMIDLLSDSNYILENGEFRDSTENIDKISANIHPDDKEKFRRDYNDITSGAKDKVISDLRVFEPSKNKYCDYQYVVTAARDANGNIHKLLYTRRDETAQREILREQQEAIQAHQLALQSAKLTRWQYNIKMRTSKYITDGSTYNSDILTGFRCIHPDDRHKFTQFIHQLLDSASKTSITVRLKTIFGPEYCPCEITAIVSNDKENKPESIIGIIRDISEIYNYQQQLNEKIEILEAVKRQMPVGMYFYDKHGNLVDVNECQLQFLGLDKQKFLDCKVNLFTLKCVSEESMSAIKKGQVGHQHLKYEELYETIRDGIDPTLPHGQQFEVMCSTVFDKSGDTLGYITIYHDVTESMENKQKILQLQDTVTLALESGEMSTWIYDCESRLFRILQGATINDGLMTDAEYNSFTYPEDINMLWDAIEEIRTRKVDKANVKFRLSINGKWRWYQCSLTAIHTDGKITHITGTRKDITEEVKSKEKLELANYNLEQSRMRLADSERQLRMILNKLPIPIMIKDAVNLQYIYYNEEAKRVLSIHPSNSSHNIFRDEDAILQEASDKQMLTTGEDYTANEMITLKNGSVINTYVKKVLIEHNGNKNILILRMDLTEQRNP